MDVFVQQRNMKTPPSFFALVLRALLLIGGVEPNPGPVDKVGWKIRTPILEDANLKSGEETTAMKKKLLEEYKDKVSKLEEDLGLKAKLDTTPENLRYAVYSGNVYKVRYILQTNELSVEHRFDHRKTPLILASENGHLSLVRYLVEEAGACVNARDNVKGWSALHWAAHGGHCDVVMYLVTEAKMDPLRKTVLSETPLHIAADRGHLHVVKYLQEKCIRTLFATTNDGWTPLHFACRGGHLDVVMFLVEDCAVDKDAGDSSGNKAVHYAPGDNQSVIKKFLS